MLACLLQHSIAVHKADPRASSFFIRSLGKHAKTDHLDALALARYGYERHEDLQLAHLTDAALSRLQSLLTRRADLVAMRVAERNRLKHPTYARADMRFSVESMLNTLERVAVLLIQDSLNRRSVFCCADT